MHTRSHSEPSLESLVEAGDLRLEILHPGDMQITRELALLCHIDQSSRVLDVASGTGESACFLSKSFGCVVTGVDASEFMIQRAIAKRAIVRPGDTGSDIEFNKADAHNLPFEADTFDAVISECTTCILDKEIAMCEMVRVAKPGGFVGIHDLCWKKTTPERLKSRFAEVEGETPETIEGWLRLFQKVGLEEIFAVDKSFLVPGWRANIKRKMGVVGQLTLILRASRRWGIGGLRRILQSASIFQSVHTGYGIIVGRKPYRDEPL